jgi:hypothetical protein
MYALITDDATFKLSASIIEKTPALLEKNYVDTPNIYTARDSDSMRHIVSVLRGYELDITNLSRELRGKVIMDLELFDIQYIVQGDWLKLDEPDSLFDFGSGLNEEERRRIDENPIIINFNNPPPSNPITGNSPTILNIEDISEMINRIQTDTFDKDSTNLINMLSTDQQVVEHIKKSYYSTTSSDDDSLGLELSDEDQ